MAGILNTYAGLGFKVPVYRVVPLAVVCRFVCNFSVAGGNPGKITLTATQWNIIVIHSDLVIQH